MHIVPPAQRDYLADHKLALWFSIAVMVAGLFYLLTPTLVAESAVSRVLPHGLKLLFSFNYALGGILSVYGLVRGRPKPEAAGMALLASALLVQFGAAFYLLGIHVIGSTSIILLFAIGCWQRSASLVHRGHSRNGS